MPSICDSPSDFTLPIYGGGGAMFTMSEAEQGGKVVLLSFSSWGCGACWSFYPRLNAIAEDYLPNPNLEIVSIHYGPPADEAGFDALRTAHGYPPPNFTVLLDNTSAVGPVYHEGMLPPYEYLVSRQYKIVNRWGRGTSDDEPLSFDSHNSAEVEAFIRNRLDDLLAERERWNTVLALDLSGSMDTSVTVGAVTKPKIDFLRDAVDSWLRVWRDYACCSDQLGLVYFSSNASLERTLEPISPAANVDAILADLEARSASGSTAMGAGIATAIDLLETEPIMPEDPHQRFIVVFTDGLQNRNPVFIVVGDCGGGDCTWMPQIRMASEDEFEFYDWDYLGDSDYLGPLPRILFGNAMQTAIHTIGIGAPEASLALLGVISDETGGAAYSDSEVWPNLKEFFIESLVESFRGSSLQVVGKWSGTLAADQEHKEMRFRLGRNVNTATVLVSWLDDAVPLQAEVLKDGLNLDLSRKRSQQANSSITTLRFPHCQTSGSQRIRLPAMSGKHAAYPPFGEALVSSRWVSPAITIDAEGEYTLNIRRLFTNAPADATYHVMVVADDKGVEVELDLLKAQYFTGDRIPIEIVATERRQPVKTLYEAQVEVSRPAEPFSDILLDACRKADRGDKGSVYAAAMKALWADPKLVKRMGARDAKRFSIRPVGPKAPMKQTKRPGRLRDYFEETSIPGHYKMVVTVQGITADGRAFERVVTKTALVIARPEAACSDLRGKVDKSGRNLLVTFKPADRNGYLLGPGFASRIDFTLDGEAACTVRDQRDGSYEITANLPAKDKGRDTMYATLWVAGEKVFRGPLSQLVNRSK